MGMARFLIKLLHQVQSRSPVRQHGGTQHPQQMPRLCPRQHAVCVQNSPSLCMASRKLPPLHITSCLQVRVSLCHQASALAIVASAYFVTHPGLSLSCISALSHLPSKCVHVSCALSLPPSCSHSSLSLSPVPTHPVLCLPGSALHLHSPLSHPDCPVPGPDLEINPTLESLCLSMTEHALGGEHFLFP